MIQKNVILLLLCLLSVASMAQDQNTIDQRLVDTYGEKATKLFETNKEYYDFLVYELDNSFYIADDLEMSSETKNNYFQIESVQHKDGSPFDLAVLADLSTFNIHNYNFIREADNRVIYDLGDGRYIVFYSLNEIKSNYGK